MRQQVFIVIAMGALTFLAVLLPLQNVPVPRLHYLSLHTLLEFAPTLAAFLVFATVWHTPAKEVSASLVVIATAFFAAGWLDFAHALFFVDMPNLLTPASSEGSIALWLVARLLVAVSLCGVSFCPQLKPPSARARYGILGTYTLVAPAVIWVMIFHDADLPAYSMESTSLTQLKVGLGWLITGLQVLAAWRYYRLARQSDDESLPLIFGAASAAAFSGFFFTQYQTSNDAINLLGHLYGFISCVFMYQAAFAVSVRRPYQRLVTKTQKLLEANEALRTQSLALDTTANTVDMVDLEGNVYWRNRASLVLWPPHLSEHGDQHSLFFGPRTPDPKQADAIRTTVRSGKVWRGLVHVRDARANSILMNRTVTPLRDEDGVVVGYVSVSENVEERRKVQLRHKHVLDVAIDGFWIADAHGRLLEVNAAYARMSGYTAEELLGMNMSQLEAVDSAKVVQARLQKIAQQGQGQFEARHRHKQGHEFAIDISMTYDSEVRQFFVFLRDRSERVQAAAVKQELERQLQQSQKMQALGQLTGGIAHDFNNILTAILGYSNLALSRFAPDKEGKLAIYLREIVTASERARDLIAKMLTFARTQPSASVGVICPAEVIEEVLAMMRPSIPSSIQLTSQIDDKLHIRMDAGELNQVLVNLIINARDAINGHGVIDIRLHRVDIQGQVCAASLQRLNGTYLALDVSDTGSGIAPEHMPHLFEPFFTSKNVGEGAGLGLSVVQGILWRSGAHIVVESQLGRGSRFRLLFPIVSPAEALPDPQPDPPSVRSGRGQRIWVVDDEPAVARYLGELLEDSGYSIRLFNEPAQVLAAFELARNEVDLLITDQTMPGLSGVALAVRLHSLRPNLPIILCTGRGDGIDRSEVLPQGIRHFMKPLPANELLKALAEELAQKRP